MPSGCIPPAGVHRNAMLVDVCGVGWMRSVPTITFPSFDIAYAFYLQNSAQHLSLKESNSLLLEGKGPISSILGTLDELYDSAESSADAISDPKEIDFTFEIKRFDKMPAMGSSTVFVRRAYLGYKGYA